MKILYFLLAFLLPATALPATGSSRIPDAARAIAVYPAQIRQAAQTVLGQPALLVQLSQIQAQSKAEFQKLLAPLSPEAQKELWQVVRYPKLARDLVALGAEAASSSLLAGYPKETQSAAKALLKKQPDSLRQAVAIGGKAETAFAQAIQGQTASVQDAFRSVGAHSEIFHVLSQALNLASYSPESFKKNPAPLRDEAKALAARLAAPQASTPEQAWKGQPGDDPKALATLEQSDKKFRAQNDYELDQDPHPKGARQVNVGYTPDSSLFTPIGWAYPYWFGWPTWDPFPFW